MKKLLSLFKKKDGAVLMTAISFMAVAVALCGVITTYVLIMTKTATSYTSVNENKLIADRIAEDYLKSYNDNQYNFNEDGYEGYTVDISTQYTCTAYEEGSSSPLITIVIEYDNNNSNYKYTKYEYGNI